MVRSVDCIAAKGIAADTTGCTAGDRMDADCTMADLGWTVFAATV